MQTKKPTVHKFWIAGDTRRDGTYHTFVRKSEYDKLLKELNVLREKVKE